MYIMKEIQGKSILVRVCARFELSGVDCNKGVMLNIPSQYTVYALLCHSFVESLLCHCLRARDHCCVLCDITRELLFTWYVVHQPNNPLSPNSDQDQFSPNNIHTLSTDKL